MKLKNKVGNQLTKIHSYYATETESCQQFAHLSKKAQIKKRLTGETYLTTIKNKNKDKI